MDSDLMQVDSGPNVAHVPHPVLPSVPPPPDSYDEHRGTNMPIIIDNGSTTFRWGFADFAVPRFGPNAISKYKERKTNKPLLLFGEAIDVESGAKAQTRTAWEGDVLLNFDALENALDYAFVNLGLDTPALEHPVLMTERLSTPLHSRALTSELMFEQYSVPALSYCIDGLMSFYGNNRKPETGNPFQFEEDGLCISFNTASTAVMPILNGKGILSHAKRIPWGSLQSSEYLLKLIQLKYPNFPTRVTTTQSNWMLRNFCDVSTDYAALLKSLKDPLKLRASETIIQFPFAVHAAEEKTEEELARIAEKRKEQGRKLQELAAKTRMEKLLQKENDLQHLLELRESRGEDGKREWNNKLSSEGFDDDTQLDETIKKLESDLKKARKKEAADDDPMEEPSFPLVDVPDADLDEDGLKEKKKQKLVKAGYEAQREEKREEEEREADLGGWSRKLRQEQEALMDRIKNRSRRKAALSDRKSAAAQARMKSIANLAADDRISKKKRKGVGEDTFGADDADWAIYRKINTAAPSSDEEEDIAQLQLIEQKLLTHDPTFTAQHTHASITAQRSALLTAFKPVYEEGDVEGNTRIHLNTEKWRVCEAWFSPGIAGVDSAGVGEVIQNILSRFSDAEKARLVKNIYLTGSPSQFSGMIPRLHNTLRPLLPQNMPVNIVRAADPSLDAWKGMSLFSVTSEFEKTCFTKAEYEEYGPEKIRKWWGSNWNNSFI
ncbi:chromatin remodeling complex subunit [Armillaria luteobubalina]|uniref:Chromatin remodeling complex subunit n=1 Tax=Armillaria luteobubalina TaxID=153913 RepID=A0AA39TN18_9AGAR|nr:chromatin remodeling complex subunit [Armillaria luteobubalina]